MPSSIADSFFANFASSSLARAAPTTGSGGAPLLAPAWPLALRERASLISLGELLRADAALLGIVEKFPQRHLGPALF